MLLNTRHNYGGWKDLAKQGNFKSSPHDAHTCSLRVKLITRVLTASAMLHLLLYHHRTDVWSTRACSELFTDRLHPLLTVNTRYGQLQAEIPSYPEPLPNAPLVSLCGLSPIRGRGAHSRPHQSNKPYQCFLVLRMLSYLLAQGQGKLLQPSPFPWLILASA